MAITSRHYIFHHDRITPESFSERVRSDERFRLINLDTLDLPGELVVDGMSPSENRALFSEYLGIMQVDTDADVIGSFTYSIPRKFSFAWAVETELFHLYLPEIRFEDFSACFFHPNVLYAPEFNPPGNRFGDIVGDVWHQLGETADLPERGPFKGSFIVRAEVFRELQPWLRRAAALLVQRFGSQGLDGGHSRFTTNALSGKSEEDLRIDLLRHGIGDILERLTAAFLASRFERHQMRRLGAFVAECLAGHGLHQQLARVRQGDRVIFPFASGKNRKPLLRWLCRMSREGVENYVVATDDESLFRELMGANIPAVRVESRDEYGQRVVQVGRSHTVTRPRIMWERFRPFFCPGLRRVRTPGSLVGGS